MPTIDVQAPSQQPQDATARLTGVEYPSERFLLEAQQLPSSDALDCSAPSEPIRLISPTDFESLHSSHLISHPPDSVLFPFLHGIEGTNTAQNTFFRNSAGQRKLTVNQEGRFVASVPKYRGLVWVLCDDDLVDAPKHHRDEVTTLLSRNLSTVSLDSCDDDEMSCSDDEFDIETEEEDEMPPSAVSDTGSMNLDVDVQDDPNSMDVSSQVDLSIKLEEDDKNSGAHMHPVSQRIGLQTNNINPQHERLDSGFSDLASSAASEFDSSPPYDPFQASQQAPVPSETELLAFFLL